MWVRALEKYPSWDSREKLAGARILYYVYLETPAGWHCASNRMQFLRVQFQRRVCERVTVAAVAHGG